MKRAGGLRPGEATGLVLAAVLSWLARELLPLAAAHPLRTTFALLPLLIAAFAVLERLGERAGGRRIPPRIRTAEGLTLLALVALALLADRLGIGHRVPPAVAAGLFLLLVHRAARQTLALRPLLGPRGGEGSTAAEAGPAGRPLRPSALFFWLPFVVYLAILPWSARHHPPDGDEPYYLLITHSLAYDFDVDLTDEYRDDEWRRFLDRPLEPQPGDPVGPEGELYSRHNALVPLVLAPAYRLGGRGGALVGMAFFAAALAWATLRLARHYAAAYPGETLVAWGLLAFASPLLLYSYQVWVEVPAALAAVVGLDRVRDLAPSRDGSEGPSGRRRRLTALLVVAAAVLLLPMIKIRFLLIAAPLAALAWWHAGRPRRLLVALAGLLGAIAAGVLLYNRHTYGNPLKIHSWSELELHRYTLADYVLGGTGIFFDAAFGLFATTPLWLLLIPALLHLLARLRSPERAARRQLALLVDLLVLTAPYLAVALPRNEWYGGWSPPFRYALVALPLLALALPPLLVHRHRAGARALVAALGLATLTLLTVWIVVPGWTYNFADGRTYLLDHVSARHGADLARLFPSSVRPRAATWLWPLASLVLVPIAWWWPRGRWRGAGAAGAALLLAMLAVLPAAAHRLPSRVIELEDPHVRKRGGALHPERWVVDRTRFRGGWKLRAGDRVEAPVTRGGDRARIELDLRLVDDGQAPVVLELLAGRRVLGRWRPAEGEDGWRRVSLGPVPWPEAASLAIEVHRREGREPSDAVILDRVEIEWR